MINTRNHILPWTNPKYSLISRRNVDFGDILTSQNRALIKDTKYNLIANVVHDGEPTKGTYRAHIFHKGSNRWYEMQDLHVSETLPPMITLTESYIQIYELQKEETSTMTVAMDTTTTTTTMPAASAQWEFIRIKSVSSYALLNEPKYRKCLFIF